MTSAVPAPDDVLETVDALGPPGTPVTTPEVAEGFDCTQRTIYNRLETLVEEGPLLTKKVGANSRVWWRPADGDIRRNGGASAPDVPVSLRDGRSPPFTADGEMAERIREFDWTETPIGPIEEWPAELRTAVDIMLGASEAIGIYWGDDLTLLYNDAAREQIGKKHPDALGRPAREVFPEAWETLDPMHEQVMVGEGPVRVEEQYLPLERGGNLEDVWFDSSFNPIPVADGSVGGVFNVSVEVTERIEAERKLRESEERYRTLFDSLNESMQEGFCVVELLEEGETADEVSTTDGTVADHSEPGDYRFVETNSAFEELTGVTDVVGARRSDLDVDGDLPGFGVCAEVARTGESRRVETTGEPLVDGWFDVRVFPYGGADGRQVAVLVDDITERKEADAALRASEKRLRLATDIANIAVFEWDLETDLVVGNERMNELFGYDEHETMVGAELLEERIDSDGPESVTDRLEAVFEPASDGEYEFELRVIRPDGSERWVRTNGEVFFEEDGDDRRAVRVFGTGIDITEQKQREERQEFLLWFSDALRAQPDAESIEETAVELLAEQLDLDRCWISEVFEEQGYSTVGPEQIRPDLPEMSGVFQLSEYPETMRQLATQPMVVQDADDDPRFSESETELLAGYHLRSLLVAPLREGEEDVVWALAAAMAEPRDWTDGERALLENAAERTWSAVERARAEQELADELAATRELQKISTGLIREDDVESLSEQVIDAAVGMVDADVASLQLFDSDRNDLELVTHRGFDETAESAWARVTPEHATACGKALQTGERVVVPDVETSEFITERADLETFRKLGIRAVQTTPLVSRNGDILGMLSTHWESTHEPPEPDLNRLDVLARQAADLIEHQQTTDALRKSEEKYRSLFEEMDEGFALCELVRDADGTVSDIRYLELNEAFEELTGISRSDAEGRLLTEVFPEQDVSLFEQCRSVAETGDPERVETYVPANDRWYDVRMFPREGDVIAALYDDITERKRREQREQFLLELSDQLHTLATEEEIGEVCTRLLAEELGLDRAYFVRFDADAEEALVGPEYHDSGLDPVGGLYPFSAFPEAIRQIGTGTPVYHDVASDSTLPEAERQALLDLDFGAWIGTPIRTDEKGVDWALYAVHSDPHDWSDAEISLVEEVADRTWTVLERARAEQALTRSNQSLKRLNDASRELIDADPATVIDRAPELTVEILGVEYAALWRYDTRTGDLELNTDHTVPGTDLDAIRPAGISHGRIWETFVGDEIDVENALDITDGEPWPSGLGSRAFVPLGRHGVVCVGSVDAETFDGRLLDLLEMVASTVKTAWDRAESERELTRRNEELTHLDRLNSLIRRIDQALVTADTREGIDQAVADRLVDSDLYAFAWLAEYDGATDGLTPTVWAGTDSSYLEERTASIGDAPSDDPLVAAHRTRERQVVVDIATDARATPWRETALERGARSCITVPLVYEESIYGVLTVYRETPQPDARETEVLAELGRTIAYAINAVETKTTRRSDSVVELTLRTKEASGPLARLTRETGCAITIEGLVPSATDSEVTVFFTATGVPPADLSAASSRILALEELRLLEERDDGDDGESGGGSGLFSARLTDPRLVASLAGEEVAMRSASIEAGTVTTVVDLSETEAVSDFVEELRQFVPDLELLARTTRSRSPETRYSLRATLGDRLTPRQREVLQTAYESGFFESPRVRTGEQLADTLGISQSTFTYHLRASQRRLCEAVFEPT